MTQPNPKSNAVRINQAWNFLMTTMALTNGRRVKDARKAANQLAADRRRW